MDVIGISKAQARLHEVLSRAVHDHPPVPVMLEGGGEALMIGLDDCLDRNDTEYLLSNPENARKLRASIDRMNAENA